MSNEFEKRPIADLGQKLAHLEGILGAYLPRLEFDADMQQKVLDCTKFSFSRLRSGKRHAANWELARFIELFDLASSGFDYRLFLGSFEEFETSLKRAGIGSYGSAAAHRLREVLRQQVKANARITIHRDRRLSAGGIGTIDEDLGVMCLTHRDKVSLQVPIRKEGVATDHLLLLQDFPAGRATSCLMPSYFAPEPRLTQPNLRLPQSVSGYLSFPVGGKAGYRCLYGIQSSLDLATYIGLDNTADSVPDIQDHHVAMLVDFLGNMSAHQRAQTSVSFGEYLVK